MRKKAGHMIYLSAIDERVLKRIANERNISKSAVVRKLIHSDKHLQTLNQIENNNQILNQIESELQKIGANIAQNGLDIKKDNLSKIIQNFINQIKKLKIKQLVKHTKTPKFIESTDK